MKKQNQIFFSIPFLILSWNNSFCQNIDSNIKRSIGTPYLLGKIKVAQYDYKDSINFDFAKKISNQNNDGWRIPTREEFEQISINKDYIGEFAGQMYWVVDFINKDSINSIDISSSNSFLVKSDTLLHLRLVSYIQSTPEEIIGHPFRIKGLEIAQFDFNYTMSWEDANMNCQRLGKGWRLPTTNELFEIRNNTEYSSTILSNSFYWSIDQENTTGIVNYLTGPMKLSYNTRAVKSKRFLFFKI
jgi:hypothetical protein